MATIYKRFFKRFIDIIVSSIAIVLFAIPMLIIAVAIKIDSQGPVLFKQKRFGINKTSFYIYKFRTMYIDTPKNMPTWQLKDAESHITKVGNFLRKTSLDEIPQLFNILKNDMSIVGPRPVVIKEIDLIDERDKYGANSIKPGLTGWAQINGRDEVPVATKARLDGEYVEHINGGSIKGLFMDIRCLFGTIIAVFRSDGIVEGDIVDFNDQESLNEREMLK